MNIFWIVSSIIIIKIITIIMIIVIIIYYFNIFSIINIIHFYASKIKSNIIVIIIMLNNILDIGTTIGLRIFVYNQ